jgi:oxygen-independent coproporphyrinogen-3 oxidase
VRDLRESRPTSSVQRWNWACNGPVLMIETLCPDTLRAIDAALLRRLQLAAPRYTSYPTVPEWTDSFTDEDHERALTSLAERRGEPLSLYLHVPFCKELCSYCGCNVVVTRDPARVERYLDALVAELTLTTALLGRRRPLTRIHVGGGTPTFLDERQLERLWSALLDAFSIAPNAEVAIEVDPVVTSAGQLALLGRLGFNRISMGVQDFNPAVQEAVQRHQSIAETRAAMEHARAAGFRSVNLDLIYGLPHQTEVSFARTMEAVVGLTPDRVATFSFAHVPAARPNQRRLPTAAIPTGLDKLRLLAVAQEQLGQAGYRAIGMDHFARPDDELARAQAEGRLWRDFQGYTTRRAGTTVAVGASAISDFGGAYAQNQHLLGRYQEAIGAGHLATAKGRWLSDDDRRRREVIVQLMCNGVVELGADGARYFAPELEALAAQERDGLLATRGQRIELTSLGRVFVRNVAMTFDAYLARDQRRAFSASV